MRSKPSLAWVCYKTYRCVARMVRACSQAQFNHFKRTQNPYYTRITMLDIWNRNENLFWYFILYIYFNCDRNFFFIGYYHSLFFIFEFKSKIKLYFGDVYYIYFIVIRIGTNIIFLIHLKSLTCGYACKPHGQLTQTMFGILLARKQIDTANISKIISLENMWF